MRFLSDVNWRSVAGDLVIVVVGILIAVQIDRWDTRRHDAVMVASYLDRLSADLEANETILQGLADRANRKAAAADSILDCLAVDCGLSEDALRQLVNAVRGGVNPALRSATFLDMLNTGAFELIQDTHLREQLITYYENFPAPQLPRVLDVTQSWVMPLFSLMGRHLDERAMVGSEAVRRDSSIFITSWAELAADDAVAAQLRLVSAAMFSTAPYFRQMAESTGTLRRGLLGHQDDGSIAP